MTTEFVANSLVDMSQFPAINGHIFVAMDAFRHVQNAPVQPGDLIVFYEGGSSCVSYPVQLGIDSEIRAEIEAGNAVEVEGWEIETTDGAALVVGSIVVVTPQGNERELLFQSWEGN